MASSPAIAAPANASEIKYPSTRDFSWMRKDKNLSAQSEQFIPEPPRDELPAPMALDETPESASTDDRDPIEAEDFRRPGAGGTILPMPTGAARGRVRPRKVERALKQQQAAEEALEEGDEQHPALGPVVRHLNNVIRDLTEAHNKVGALSAERDALRLRLAELTGEPIPEDGEEGERPNREARSAARAESATSMSQVARRRQLIAVGALVVLGIGIYVARSHGLVLDNVSRDVLAKLPLVGPLMQVFLIGWLVYRVARVSGKGARWLFPAADGKRKRRR